MYMFYNSARYFCFLGPCPSSNSLSLNCFSNLPSPLEFLAYSFICSLKLMNCLSSSACLVSALFILSRYGLAVWLITCCWCSKWFDKRDDILSNICLTKIDWLAIVLLTYSKIKETGFNSSVYIDCICRRLSYIWIYCSFKSSIYSGREFTYPIIEFKFYSYFLVNSYSLKFVWDIVFESMRSLFLSYYRNFGSMFKSWMYC